jgi:hypothetical protein
MKMKIKTHKRLSVQPINEGTKDKSINDEKQEAAS